MRPSDAALERARYAADLWLVHTDRSGREQRQHAIVNMDGASVFPLVFGRLPFAIPQIDVRQGGAEAVIDFRGSLRLRPRADGLVDVDLDTQRMLFRLEDPDRPVRRSAGSITAARKTLTVRVDETTAIDFPPPSSGYSALALGGAQGTSSAGAAARPRSLQGLPAADGPAIEVKDGQLVLHTNRFFKGHRTQLLVTLRRVR